MYNSSNGYKFSKQIEYCGNFTIKDDKELIDQKIRKAKTDQYEIPENKEKLLDRPEATNLLTIYASLANKSLDETLNLFSGSDFKKLNICSSFIPAK